MTEITLPEEYKDVMLRYRKDGHIKTKRGFYSKLFGRFAVPPEYRHFDGILLPHGWGGDYPSLSCVIRWTYCED